MRTLALAIQDCDRKDGSGVDWLMMVKGIFLAGFDAAKKLDDQQQRDLFQRIHEAAYGRITEGEGRDSMGQTPKPEGEGQAVRAFNQPTPKGPR